MTNNSKGCWVCKCNVDLLHMYSVILPALGCPDTFLAGISKREQTRATRTKARLQFLASM